MTRTTTLAALRESAQRADIELASVQQEITLLNRRADVDTARADATTAALRERLEQAAIAAARHEDELHTLRAQSLLDTEDRAVLRMLLRTARKQSQGPDRVYVVFHHGALHSVHATSDAAEDAAERDGAIPGGWTASPTADRPTTEAPWRIQRFPLGA
ncbi:hypothetical protein DVH02_14145 [Streptomyces corynorhini]|uniref:Uncharacterized protein n=1 Tax=Streptomyces corynorhini TaxID=2282652 RepID=A0A370B6U0_9ACTN|nr:hypothetical protein DVH02_14145 [Streptomyces corynorhini]